MSTECDAAAENLRLKACTFRRQGVEIMQEAMKRTKLRDFTSFMANFFSALIPDASDVSGINWM